MVYTSSGGRGKPRRYRRFGGVPANDVHSPPMNTQQQETIARAFNLGTPIACASLGGTRNENVRLTTEAGDWVVRLRYSGYSNPDRVDFDHAALAHLARRQVPVLLPRTMESGAICLVEGDAVWEVFPFIEGESPVEGNAEHVEAVGAALSRLHAAGKGFGPRLNKLGPRGEMDPIELLDIATRINGESPECTAVLRPYRCWTVSAARALTQREYEALPHTLVHGDIQPANIIMVDGHVAAFVDWDWCAWRPRIYDLACALLFCCARHEAPIDGASIWSLTQPATFDTSLVRRFFKAYAVVSAPMDMSEKAALQHQIHLTWCHCRLAGALKVARERRLEFLARGPADIAEFTAGIE